MLIKILVGLVILIILVRIIDEISEKRNHKKLILLLKNGGPLLEKLTTEIEKRKITLVPFGFMERWQGQNPQKHISQMISVILSSKNKILLFCLKILEGKKPKIIFSENQVKGIILNRFNIGQLELFLAHEIGHHIANIEFPDCQLFKERVRRMEFLDCLFNELRATEEGLKLIDEIWGIENWQVELWGKNFSKSDFCYYVLSISYNQCIKCDLMINCPKYKEIGEVQQRIKRLLFK